MAQPGFVERVCASLARALLRRASRGLVGNALQLNRQAPIADPTMVPMPRNRQVPSFCSV